MSLSNSSSSSQSKNIPFVSVAGVVGVLYLAQGLPGGLIAHALPAFLRAEGASLTIIGSLKLLALPWLLKFLWAPYVDGNGSFQQRSRWIFLMQGMAALSLVGLSFFVGSAESYFIWLSLLCLLALNVASSTQDIATDGLTASLTPSNRLGIANSLQVIGYKVGMLIGGSGLLYFSQHLPLTDLMLLLAVFLILLLGPVGLFKKRYQTELSVASNVLPDSQERKTSFKQTYKGFFNQQGILVWLSVLLSYKLADSFGSAMLKPLLVDTGIELEEIGEITLYSSVIGLLGAACAGIAYKRIGALACLLAFGILQGASVSSFYLIAAYDLSDLVIYSLVIVEQFCDGLSTVVLFALMMQHCRKGHEGADYTIQASIQIVLAGLLGAVSGMLADAFGYQALYIFCALLGVLSVLIVLHYRQHKITTH